MLASKETFFPVRNHDRREVCSFNSRWSIKSLPRHDVHLTFKPDTEFFLHRLPYPECEIKYLPATGAAIIYKNQSLFFIAPCMA